MSDLNDLEQVFGDSEATPAPKPEAGPAPQPEAVAAEQPRDENGRFAPKQEQPASAAPETPAPVQPAAQAKPLIDPEQFKGYLEEREKRQKLEAEIKALRERVEQQSAQPIPSFDEDPNGYVAHMQEQIQRTAISNRFDASEFAARQSHGDDTVQQAMDWGMEKSNASQAFATEYLQQRHPIDWIVKQYKRDQLFSSIGDDPDAWALRRAQELAAAQGQQPNPQGASPASPQPAPAATPPPTRSLASATSAGGITAPVDPGLKPLEQEFGR